MNRVSGWAERLSWAVLIMMVTLPAHAQLMLAHEGHHSGDCVIKGGAFSVNFSAYEKPKGGDSSNARVLSANTCNRDHTHVG